MVFPRKICMFAIVLSITSIEWCPLLPKPESLGSTWISKECSWTTKDSLNILGTVQYLWVTIEIEALHKSTLSEVMWRESPKVLQNKDITCLCYHWLLFTIFCLLPKSVGTKLCKVGNFTLNLNSLNCDKIRVLYTSCIHVIWLTLCDCYSLKEINASISIRRFCCAVC